MYPVRRVNVECLFIPGILVMTHGLVKEWLCRAVPGSYAAVIDAFLLLLYVILLTYLFLFSGQHLAAIEHLIIY